MSHEVHIQGNNNQFTFTGLEQHLKSVGRYQMEVQPRLTSGFLAPVSKALTD
jgi:hypothetical protein